MEFEEDYKPTNFVYGVSYVRHGDRFIEHLAYSIPELLSILSEINKNHYANMYDAPENLDNVTIRTIKQGD